MGVVLVNFHSQSRTEIVQGISDEIDASPYQAVIIPAGRSRTTSCTFGASCLKT